MAVVEHRFGAMASAGHLILVDPSSEAIDHAVARINQLEQRWSRFIDTSDLARLARAAGAWCEVSPDTVTLIATMVRARRVTSGLYDPTMVREIIAAGYDRSHDSSGRRSITIDLPHPTATIADAEIDATAVRLPEGMALDPGGIGKGLATDLIAAELVEAGTAGALVSLGGDLTARGRPPDDRGWRIRIEDPFVTGSALATVTIDGGGVATSSTRTRSWATTRGRRHHVLDPRSGLPAAGDAIAATAIAPTGWEAEVHATAALVVGIDHGVEHLRSIGLDGVLIDGRGTCRPTPGLAALAGAAACGRPS